MGTFVRAFAFVGIMGTVLSFLLTASSVSGQADIRLVNGATSYQGRVEVLVDRKWNTICGDYFDIKDAHVVCKTLGFPSAIVVRDRAYFGKGKGKVIRKLDCTGVEDDITNCKLNVAPADKCGHGEDVGVECHKPQPSPPVRLTCPYNKTCNKIARKRGPDPGECTPSVHVEGIVEVYYNGRWWPVSADEWDDEDVNVLCGQLGYPVSFGTVSKLTDIVPHASQISKRQKNQFKRTHLKKAVLRRLACTGTERDLSSCLNHGWGPFDNPGGEVATARCGFHPHPSCDGECQRVSCYTFCS